MQVSIVMVNYKTYELTKNAIASIEKETKGITYEIVVVDNSEDSEETKKLKTLERENVHVFQNIKNNGFGAGNNFGVKETKGEYVLFLNTDTQLVNNAVFELYNVISKDDSIGAVGANLLGKDLKPTTSFELKEKNLKNEKESILVDYILKKKIIKNYYYNYSDKPLVIEGYICGACLMIKRSVFDEIGGFNENIFMYAEEVLLCRQIREKSHLKLVNVPSAIVIHFEGGSIGWMDSKKAKRFVDGNYLYYLFSFGNKTSLKYLKRMKRKCHKKQILLSLLGKKEKASYYNYLFKAFLNKINEIR